VNGIITDDRIMLAQAITLAESHLPEDESLAEDLLQKIMPHTGNSLRVGITGVPGVGKSTFIESLGHVILKSHKKLAVLSIDPTSPIGGGSILGDKTRMETLSKHPQVFIRPSASLDAMGGVAEHTRETMLLCEAAGYDVILIETVGVGQSEYAVKDMVDFFLLLMLAGVCDDLPGMKKGIMELADMIAITKADGDNVNRARQAQAVHAQAMHNTRTPNSDSPTVVLTSALTQSGIAEVWNGILAVISNAKKYGTFEAERARQYASWFRTSFEGMLKDDVTKSAGIPDLEKSLLADVAVSKRSPRNAAAELLKAYHHAIRVSKK